MSSIDFPNTLTKIGSSAFQGCQNLKCINFPNSLTEIDRYAFQDCSGMTSISMSNSLKSINDGVFENCIGLTEIELPETLESFWNDAFKGCVNLKAIHLGAVKPPRLYTTVNYLRHCTLYIPKGSLETYQADSSWIYWVNNFKEIIEE